MVSALASDALKIANDKLENYMTIVPLTDLMKISMDTIEEVTSESWMIPSTDRRRFRGLENSTGSTDQSH
eukprot:12037507-Ditylum_brightwellii.AAC.1